jgi:plasmid stability protein
MSMLTVRDLDPEVKEKLRRRAARHGHSMEA